MDNKVRGFVLKKTKYSEADLIIHLLASDGRKLSFLARGALRSKKRFGGGVLEPTHFIEAQYKENNKEDSIKTLTEASVVNDFAKLRKDYDRLSLALYFVEVVAKVGQEGDVESESLFNLIGNALSVLESTKNLDLIKVHFSLKLLHQQGILEVENWMKIFLTTPIKETDSLAETYAPEISKYMNWCDQAVREYMATAEKF